MNREVGGAGWLGGRNEAGNDVRQVLLKLTQTSGDKNDSSREGAARLLVSLSRSLSSLCVRLERREQLWWT